MREKRSLNDDIYTSCKASMTTNPLLAVLVNQYPSVSWDKCRGDTITTFTSPSSVIAAFAARLYYLTIAA